MNCRVIGYRPLREVSQERCINPDANKNSKITLKSVKDVVSFFDLKAGEHLSLKTGEFRRDVVREEKITITCGNKYTTIDYGRVLKEVRPTIAKYAGDDGLWRQQEMKTYLSAEINRSIDLVCAKLNRAIGNQQKKDIFSAMSKYGIDIDVVCAQSTIKQVLNTKILQKGDYLASKMQEISHPDDKINNETKTASVDTLASKIFEDYFLMSEATVEDLKSRGSELAVDAILDTESLSASDKIMIKEVTMVDLNLKRS